MGANLPSVDFGLGRTAVAVTAGYQHTCALLVIAGEREGLGGLVGWRNVHERKHLSANSRLGTDEASIA